mmetsp:Transcript_106057/g.182980  ORF Transcript_106057/g.182980 Transcript_106057/m.182980 type:complete len:528 (-) Transcript_106057:1184-2767(-)
MTLLADGRLHFDNELNCSWSKDFTTEDWKTYSQYLQWVDEPREDKDKDEGPEEEVQPRVYTEEEVRQFHAEQVRLHVQRKTLLVLDLDHTLVHCTRNKDYAGNAPSFRIGHEVWFFDFRPGLVQFLQSLQAFFEIHIYTHATRPYAEHLINAICSLMPDPGQVRFRTLFTRNECLDKKRKSVSEMFPDGSMVLVVDDNKGAVWTENENLIKIPPYYHFGKKAKRSPNDQHLLILASFLKKYHAIFFEQQTCETKVILAKMREVAASICPLDLVAIANERERRKERHRDKERKKEEKVQKERDRAEKERLKRFKEQQYLSLVAAQQYAHVHPTMQLPPGEVTFSGTVNPVQGGTYPAGQAPPANLYPNPALQLHHPIPQYQFQFAQPPTFAQYNQPAHQLGTVKYVSAHPGTLQPKLRSPQDTTPVSSPTHPAPLVSLFAGSIPCPAAAVHNLEGLPTSPTGAAPPNPYPTEPQPSFSGPSTPRLVPTSTSVESNHYHPVAWAVSGAGAGAGAQPIPMTTAENSIAPS